MVYLSKTVIFHGYVSHNQMVTKTTKGGIYRRPQEDLGALGRSGASTPRSDVSK